MPPLCRIPEEPDISKHPETSEGVCIPPVINFTEREEVGPDEWKRRMRMSLASSVTLGLQLTTISHVPKSFVEKTETAQRSVTIGGETYTLDFKIDTIKVAGAGHPELRAIRHTVRFPSLEADYVYGGYTRITYTSAIDKYTYKVEELENFSDVEPEVFSWCSVVHTQDSILPLFNVREFVTLDTCSKKDYLVSSRSCYHPAAEVTPPPRDMLVPACTRGRRYRSPLVYFQRVYPHPPEGGVPSCTLVQFHYSDVGGLVPPEEQVKAVRQFGLDNLPKTFALLKKAHLQGIALGKGSKGYLGHPLHPCWKQDPFKMLPRVDKKNT